MKPYSRLTNCIAGCLSADTADFIRLNTEGKTQHDAKSNTTYHMRAAKMVFNDYKGPNSGISFALRLLELNCDGTVVPTKELTFAQIKEDDKSLVEFNSLDVALTHAGFGLTYLAAMADINAITVSHMAKERGHTIIAASNEPGKEVVGLFVQLEDSVVVVQFMMK